jgi:hypothetical protein
MRNLYFVLGRFMLHFGIFLTLLTYIIYFWSKIGGVLLVLLPEDFKVGKYSLKIIFILFSISIHYFLLISVEGG